MPGLSSENILIKHYDYAGCIKGELRGESEEKERINKGKSTECHSGFLLSKHVTQTSFRQKLVDI
jgi:HSP20 family molecular chaperone IbpA